MSRNEYPRPQFKREDWVCLNGTWSYHISRKSFCYRNNDIDQERVNSKGFKDTLQVPFAPETKLSGAEEKELIDRIYYHKEIEIPSSWKEKRILLHFGAVFYHATIFIDGVEVGFHDGGSTSFTVDLTRFVKAGEKHHLVVKATANLQDGSIPSGKQSSYISSYTCFYQRTTGIWQTVWMEAVSLVSLKRMKVLWNGFTSVLSFVPEYHEIAGDYTLRIKATSPKGETFTVEGAVADGLPLSLKIENPDLWEPGHPSLYSLEYIVLKDGVTVDSVSSYTGLRTIEAREGRIFINGKSIYLRLVLDQGFYPEGNWTAPDDEALLHDIELSMAAGFNGARLHQKVFEERFYYHADRLGYLVWGESASWGLDYNNEGHPARNFLSEWRETILRDQNHPSIIAWTPLNETFYVTDIHSHRRLHKEAYEMARSLDPTRPVNDSSGYIHYFTDLWTVHTYIQDPAKLKAQLEMKEEGPFRNYPKWESPYEGQPYIVDEYGGVKWDPETQARMDLATSQNLESWGYGDAPRNEKEYLERVRDLTDVILSFPHISGYCYTQLTDVEQEKNGVYFYNRSSKFPTEEFHRIFSKKPEDYDL